jgi:pimeloyl-ACP methyl ester carboxylesterase
MITVRRRGPAVRAALQLIMVLAALLLGSGLLLGSILLVDTPPVHAKTTLTPGPCGRDGQLQSQVTRDALPGGALYLICVPLENPQTPQPEWNGDLVVYAHGYTSPTKPLDFQNLRLNDGTYLPDLILSQGYAFATTSYRQNGLAILEGADDIRKLVKLFPKKVGGQKPNHTYLSGVSEGALITTLLIEQSPKRFSGGLAACGPISSIRDQINYFGDFRVLFDYFFPGVLPPSPTHVPMKVMTNWKGTYVPRIKQALAANPSVTAQLMNTFILSSGAPIDLSDPARWESATVNLLWYNVFATNDARQKLGGNPFDNTNRVYSGSANDSMLNENIARFGAKSIALDNLVPYETSGQVKRPLVTIHTTGDEVVPYWQELRYLNKVETSKKGQVTPIRIVRYGHCAFSSQEVLGAFNLLVSQVNQPQTV